MRRRRSGSVRPPGWYASRVNRGNTENPAATSSTNNSGDFMISYGAYEDLKKHADDLEKKNKELEKKLREKNHDVDKKHKQEIDILTRKEKAATTACEELRKHHQDLLGSTGGPEDIRRKLDLEEQRHQVLLEVGADLRQSGGRISRMSNILESRSLHYEAEVVAYISECARIGVGPTGGGFAHFKESSDETLEMLRQEVKESEARRAAEAAFLKGKGNKGDGNGKEKGKPEKGQREGTRPTQTVDEEMAENRAGLARLCSLPRDFARDPRTVKGSVGEAMRGDPDCYPGKQSPNAHELPVVGVITEHKDGTTTTKDLEPARDSQHSQRGAATTGVETWEERST